MTTNVIKSGPKRKTREEILKLSVPLFAKNGFNGVSMRDVAAAVGLTTAALYYHFPDKEQLYLDVVAAEFSDKFATLKGILDGPGSPWSRLEVFVAGLALLAATDKGFLRLTQWVLLDSDETRQRKLAEHVFKDLFVPVYNLAAQLDSRHDAHVLAISVIGLVLHHYSNGTIRKFIPGHQPKQDNPTVVARYVIDLLRTGLSEPGGGGVC